MEPTKLFDSDKRKPLRLRHPAVAHMLVFAAVWLLVFAMPWLGMFIVIATDGDTGWQIVHRSWIGLLPYFFVSLIHEFVLVPLFLLHRRYLLYTLALVIVLGGFTIYENHTINTFQHTIAPHIDILPHSLTVDILTDVPYINLRVLKRLAMALLIVGVGLSYCSVTGYRRRLYLADMAERHRLRDELRGLRSQISPHFFMNMLNNIHSAMETDVPLARAMLLKLSQMMRYVTYDTTLETVPLNRELDFICSYIELMKTRYPAERVAIRTDFPAHDIGARCAVPPMLFITFLENAFKHGVTYRRPTDISVTLSVVNRRIVFTCVNTIPPETERHSADRLDSRSYGGFGLANVRSRLDMLFANDYILDINKNYNNNTYSVKLDIPANETEMHSNR